jgi:hypothetical protein
MTTTFTPAARGAIPLLIGLEGASGSGKTKSSLEILHGIGEAIREMHGREPKLAVVDTENRRALIYADDYSFHHVDMQPPFSPLAFGDILEDAEKAGYDAIMFDSFSHEWSGEGGVKEWAERIEAGVPKRGIANPRTGPKDGWDWWKDWETKPVQGPGAWAEPKSTLKGGHKWLINQMLRSKMHVIISLRSTAALKMDQVPIMENGQPKLYTTGKNTGKPMKETVVVAPADLPLLERWTPDCEKNLPYEMTTSMLFTPDRAGVPTVRKRIGTQGAPQIDESRQMNAAWGKALALWAEGKGAKPVDYSGTLQQLESYARKGTNALSGAWQNCSKETRQALAAELGRLKDIAFENDQQQQQPEPEPEPEQQRQPERDTGGYDGV